MDVTYIAGTGAVFAGLPSHAHTNVAGLQGKYASHEEQAPKAIAGSSDRPQTRVVAFTFMEDV